MGEGKNKASKYANKQGIVYNIKIVDGFINIVLILLLMGIMFTAGICFDGECVYIETRNEFTGEVSQPSNIFNLALKLQGVLNWLFIAYVGLSAWKLELTGWFKNGRKRKRI